MLVVNVVGGGGGSSVGDGVGMVVGNNDGEVGMVDEGCAIGDKDMYVFGGTIVDIGIVVIGVVVGDIFDPLVFGIVFVWEKRSPRYPKIRGGALASGKVDTVS